MILAGSGSPVRTEVSFPPTSLSLFCFSVVLSASQTLRRTSSMVTDWSHKLATLTITCWIGKAVLACLISGRLHLQICHGGQRGCGERRVSNESATRLPDSICIFPPQMGVEVWGSLVGKTDFCRKYSVEKRQAGSCGYPPLHGQSRTPSFFHGIFS